MSKTSRTYSNEFKIEAVKLMKEIGASQASKDLGVTQSLLYCWKSKFEGHQPSDKLSYEDLVKQNQKLKKEMAYVNKINDVLKKSLGIFTKDQI